MFKRRHDIHYNNPFMLSVSMLNIVMLNVRMLSVVMLNVSMLSVVAPFKYYGHSASPSPSKQARLPADVCIKSVTLEQIRKCLLKGKAQYN
jgi:hypothetical protein